MKYVIGTIVLTLFLFTLFDFIHKSTKYFVEYDPDTSYIIQYYLYQTPAQILQALPIAALMASVIAMVLLSRTNEITAMRAAGMGPIKIGAPLAAGGLLLSFLALFLGEIVVPKMSQKKHYVQDVLIEGNDEEEIAQGARWVRDKQTLINFKSYDAVTQKLEAIKIVEVRPNFRPKQTLEAESAEFIQKLNKWKLENIKVTFFQRDGTLDKIEYRADQTIEIPVEPKKLKKERRNSNELSISELNEMIRRGDASGADTTAFKVDYHLKYAYPFAAFVVSLIGLKFGYRSERATETAKGVLFAFMIGIGYWFFLNAGRALGQRGSLRRYPFYRLF